MLCLSHATLRREDEEDALEVSLEIDHEADANWVQFMFETAIIYTVQKYKV